MLFWVVAVMAQITYNSSDYATIGDVYTLSQVNPTSLLGKDFSKSGANQTWNYATLGISSQISKTYTNPINSGYRESFVMSCILAGGLPWNCYAEWSNLTNVATPSAASVNLGQFQLSNNVDFMLLGTSNVQTTILGTTLTYNNMDLPMTITYELPDVLYHFPMNYENADSCESRYSIDLNQVNQDLIYKKFQKRVNKVHGWGQLNTPFGNFASVLKVKTTIEHKDTIITGGVTYPTTYKEVIYSWFSNDYSVPVLEVKGIIGFMGIEVYSSATFVDIVRCLEPNAQFYYYPFAPVINAETHEVSVYFSNMSQNAANYEWNFGDTISGVSNTSTEMNPSHIFTNGGNYEVKLIATNTICQPTRYDTTTYPIFVSDTSEVAANFFYYPTTPTLNDSVQFINISTNSYLFTWNFGDGNSSTLRNPKHKFNTTGVFTVQLIAENSSKIDTTEKSIEILITGIQQHTKTNQFNIYPTLVENELIIENYNSNQIVDIEVYNINSNLIFNSKINSSKNVIKINTTNWNSGIYVVRIKGRDKTEVQRIIKK